MFLEHLTRYNELKLLMRTKIINYLQSDVKRNSLCHNIRETETHLYSKSIVYAFIDQKGKKKKSMKECITHFKILKKKNK